MHKRYTRVISKRTPWHLPCTWEPMQSYPAVVLTRKISTSQLVAIRTLGLRWIAKSIYLPAPPRNCLSHRNCLWRDDTVCASAPAGVYLPAREMPLTCGGDHKPSGLPWSHSWCCQCIWLFPEAHIPSHREFYSPSRGSYWLISQEWHEELQVYRDGGQPWLVWLSG